MRGNLVDRLHLFDVPGDLTYFRHGDKRLVVNPGVGARCVLDAAEFRVLEEVSRYHRDGGPVSLAATAETDKALAKLILSWLVYFNGNTPTVTVKEPPLKYAYYAVTDGCNLRCPYCYASSEKCLPGELTTQESLDLISEIAAFGSTHIVFTGGEPMLRKDLFRLVEHANACGLKSNIITNATMIRKPEQAQRFAELFDMVTISLDGGTAETHDRTRGKGSFARTYRAIRLLNAAGVVPEINHVLTSESVDDLEAFATFVEGIEIGSIRLMNHNDLGRGVSDEYDFGWPDHLRVQNLAWTSPVAGKLRPDGPSPITPCSVKGNCGMGGNEIYVNSLGDVYPCKLVTGPKEYAGNVRQQSLAEIFASPVLKEMRLSTVFEGEFHEDCAKCYIRASCGGGCRAYHMSESGDLRRNSRHLCRILRHGMVTQMWQQAGVGRAELAKDNLEMAVPRMVSDGRVHQVFEDWKGYVPAKPAAPTGPSASGARRPLIPITPVQKEAGVVHSGQ